MIVLTGTSGGLASSALETILKENLLKHNEFWISSASGKTSSKSAIEAGIEVRRGDLNDPDSLKRAFAGAEGLFLVSYPSVGEERFHLHRNAIDAAKEVGVQHVLYTSLSFGGPSGERSVAGVMQAHIKTVEYLKASELKWTILRFPTYLHLWNNFAGFLDLNSKGDTEVVFPDDGPNTWANREELGEATGKLLARWREYAGKTINFTGPEAVDVRQLVAQYNKYSNRTIRVKMVGVEEAVDYHKRNHTLPPGQEEFLLNWASWSVALANGEADYLDPAFEQLLGRKPKTVNEQAKEVFSAQNALDTKDFN